AGHRGECLPHQRSAEVGGGCLRLAFSAAAAAAEPAAPGRAQRVQLQHRDVRVPAGSEELGGAEAAEGDEGGEAAAQRHQLRHGGGGVPRRQALGRRRGPRAADAPRGA
ncbi:unnamed protein product, partial [Effrenium voratum]